MNGVEYDKYVQEAIAELKQLNEAYLNQFNIGSYEEWFYDQEVGLFFFKNNNIAKVVARYEAIGSLSTLSNTWLWSWSNPSTVPELSKKMLTVKAFGEIEQLDELKNAKWAATEEDAWAMAAVAVKVLNLKGAYRCPTEYGYLFVAFSDIQWQQ